MSSLFTLLYYTGRTVCLIKCCGSVHWSRATVRAETVHISTFAKARIKTNEDMSTIPVLEAMLLKLRAVLHTDNAQRAMLPNERAQYVAKICSTANKLAKLKLEAQPTANTTWVPPQKASRPEVGKALIVYVSRFNEKGCLQKAVLARCASGQDGFAWGQQAPSVKFALRQLSAICVCGARFHIVRR